MARIIGWTFEADYHCIACAEKRYPELAIFNSTVLDREGNECHPVFSWDETDDAYCGDCLQRLDGSTIDYDAAWLEDDVDRDALSHMRIDGWPIYRAKDY